MVFFSRSPALKIAVHKYAAPGGRIPFPGCQDQPVISVDAKKKELVGDFKNNGKEYRPQGDPEKVRVRDFMIKDEDHGRVTPYGVYDLNNNTGWVNLGTDSDTSAL